ncbi:hypothetical protein HPP92_024411 [Vanilla planifolia]|uniref:Uncharacterized protein n=1 Tax=Vanilla planifolia TaxID=51239 RepID=A0A835UCX4_VANPL|nr:hypothetical protein HPP92_024411 [Vanilla planifolia]
MASGKEGWQSTEGPLYHDQRCKSRCMTLKFEVMEQSKVALGVTWDRDARGDARQMSVVLCECGNEDAFNQVVASGFEIHEMMKSQQVIGMGI